MLTYFCFERLCWHCKTCKIYFYIIFSWISGYCYLQNCDPGVRLLLHRSRDWRNLPSQEHCLIQYHQQQICGKKMGIGVHVHMHIYSDNVFPQRCKINDNITNVFIADSPGIRQPLATKTDQCYSHHQCCKRPTAILHQYSLLHICQRTSCYRNLCLQSHCSG